jgi:hypothetical protein
MLVLANEIVTEMFNSPSVFAWVLLVFVRLQPGKEEFFSPPSRSVFLFFPRGRRQKTMKGVGGKGQGGQAGQGQARGQVQGKEEEEEEEEKSSPPIDDTTRKKSRR